MTAGTALWAGLLLVLIVLFLLVARRMSALIARTRDLERIQRSVDSIDRRLAAATDPLVTRLDGVRRRAVDPRDLGPYLEASGGMLRDLAAEVRALRVPPPLARHHAALLHEAERSVRAAELVALGLEGLLAARGGHESEAQTSLKRGTLNLRNARESFGRTTTAILALRPADLATARADHSPGPGQGAPATFGEATDPGAEGPTEPRM